MDTKANLIDILLYQINNGEAADALVQIDALLGTQPNHPGLLTLKAEALRLAGHALAAADAYRRAGAVGGGPRNWQVAGILLQAAGRLDDAIECLAYANAEDPLNATVLEGLVAALLEQIGGGQPEHALRHVDALLDRHPGNLGLLTLRAEALRTAGRRRDAIDAYRRAALAGAGARNWLVAGILLGEERRFDEAVDALLGAIADAPGDEEVLNTLVTTLFNANRYQEGVLFAMRLLGVSRDERHLSNAALLLQTAGQHEEASEVFKKFIGARDDNPAQLGAALVPARYTCEWDWIESIQSRIGAHYAQGRYAAAQEYPLTHVTWCADEAHNLAVTQAYVASRTPADALPLVASPRRAAPGERIRIGYLSCDFCNHATMHLLAGLLEHHDRDRFEIYAYDYSKPDTSAYRQRFLAAIDHHVDVTALTDADAAARIAQDRLDILFDLKGHTGWARPAILAYRPAPLQVAYLGYPGSTGASYVDYVVGDRFVTPDGSAPFYTEKLCRLPHSYQCNDRKRQAVADPGTRASHGLPDDAVVFCSFNQSYKIDRQSFAVWMRVLHAVPGSVLWLLGQGDAAQRNLRRVAAEAGVAPERLIFSPFATPEWHLARLTLADAALDTLVCNGHTTTSDALWAGVPVITARGVHFASRVTESLLNAMDLDELVGSDHDDMVRIAAHIGHDADYRAQVRARVGDGIAHAPLFDTARFTRHFETAIERMVSASRSGEPLPHIDVAECAA
ncbi:hypothetical protein [Burkholderia guangdongensis]|uniref:O-linked N-acetylglucosamine transferase, SPINDLY family protein n=1 Tax=Burkholderia guangdongensis TaxID=1792500 RepID=UPI0015CD68A8|nr:hypothetical protein [Burkholderia guangdongensis]